jgi:hypothetical protein
MNEKTMFCKKKMGRFKQHIISQQLQLVIVFNVLRGSRKIATIPPKTLLI